MHVFSCNLLLPIHIQIFFSGSSPLFKLLFMSSRQRNTHFLLLLPLCTFVVRRCFVSIYLQNFSKL